MSDLIKKMLAERAARERATSERNNLFSEGVERIRKDRDKLDEGFCDQTKWAPSELLMIGYCVLATSAHPESAEELLRDRLGER